MDDYGIFVSFPHMLEPCRLDFAQFHLFSCHPAHPLSFPYIGTFKSTFASNPPESWHNHWIGLDITDMNFNWCCWCFRNPEKKKPVEVGSLSHYSQGLLHLRCLAGFLPSRDINFHHLIVNSQQTGAQFEPFWASHGEDLPPFLTRSHQNCPNHRSREAVQLWSLLHQVAKLLSNPWKRIWCNELRDVKAHT